MRIYKRALTSSASTILLACVSVSAFAQTSAIAPAAPAPVEGGGEGASGEDIVVTGSYARSLRAATEMKRTANYQVDSINSTDIGKFPTQNVAEALQLVTGVAITRPRGEGLNVSVRGLGPQFQNTLLNGSPVAVNEVIENGGAAGRQFRFEMLPAEFTSSIDVVKTPTSDMTEGALGGNINVKTFEPFDVGTKTTLNLRGTYTEQTGKVKPNATVISSWVNKDDTFGILVGGQYWAKDVRNDRWYNSGWYKDRFASQLGQTGLYLPTRTRPTVETEKRERISGMLSMQWRPNPEMTTTLNVLATRLDVKYDEYGLDIYPDDTSIAGHKPTIVPGSVVIDGDTVVKATINDVRFMASREYSLNRHDLINVGLRQTWDRDAWHVAGTVNWSYAHSYHPSYDVGTVRSRAMFFAPLTYDATRGYKHVPDFNTTVDPTNPANYQLYQFNIAPKNSKDWNFYTRGDVAHDFEGFISKLSIGGEYQFRKRNYSRRDFLVNPTAGTPLSSLGSGAYEQLPFDDYLQGLGGNIPRQFLVPVTSAYLDAFFTPTVENSALTPADLAASFRTTEKILSAYARADYDFTVGSVPVTGNIGVRYVHTDQVAGGNLRTGNVITPVKYPKTFNNVLPSFNLRAELTPTLVGRLSASRVLTRPNVTDSAPRITISTDAPTASGGNPDLVPFLATQFDGSLEWYFNQSGSLTGAVFYKSMDDYITQQNVPIDIPGRGTVQLSTQVNGGDAKVYGFEAAYQQVFTFLPQPFDGLGFQASYTRTSVKANYTAGSRVIKDEMIGLSKNSFNVVGFYEKGPISTRLSYVWRDRYLSGTGSTTQAPTYTAAFGSLDGSIAYRLTGNVTLSLEAINIAKARQYTYNDLPIRYGDINDYGRTILFGARAEF